MKKRIIIISSIVIAIILLSIAAVIYYNISTEELQKQATLEKLNGITNSVSQLYETNEKELLKENIVQEDINQILNNINDWLAENPSDDIAKSLNDSKLELSQIQEMFDINCRIKETEITTNELLSEEVITQIEQDITVWEEIKPIFFANLKERLDTIKLVNETKSLVYDLFSDSTYEAIKDTITFDQINLAKEKIETMQDGENKDNINALIAIAEDQLTKLENEREEARKKEAQTAKNNSSKNSSSSSSSNSSGSSSSSNSSSSGTSSGNGTYYGEITAAQLEESRVIARQIANSIGPGTDLERVTAAAQKVSEYYSRGVHKEEGPYYNSAYGVFIAGESSCAGCTRALGMVLEYMGYSWTHKNRGQWSHQWVVIQMDGQTGWADGQIGLAGYGEHLYM